MKQSAKTFGYGFSALVLALGGVVMSPNVNAAETVEPYNCTTNVGEENTTYVKTAAELVNATKAGVKNKTIVLCNDITLSEDLAILETGLTLDLNGKTLTGNIDAGSKSLTISDDSTAAGTFTGTVYFALGEKNTIEIDGGNFTGTVFTKTGTASQGGSGQAITIKNGTFTGTLTNDGVATEKIITVEGGTFSSDPSSFVTNEAKNIYNNADKNIFVVAGDKNTIAGPQSTIAVGEEIEAAFKLGDTTIGDIDNYIDFTVTEGDSSSVEITPVRVRKSTTIDSYTLKISKVGSYKIKATSNDKNAVSGTYNSAEFEIEVVDAAEKTIEDIYTIKSDTKIDVSSYVKKYATDTETTATYKSSDGEIATIDEGGKITTVKAGKATITVTFQATGEKDVSAFSFDVYILDEVADDESVIFYNLNSKDIENAEDVLTVSEDWGEAVNSDASVATATRDDINPTSVTVKPGSKVGKTTITYTTDKNAWVFNGTKILDGSKDSPIVPLTNEITVYTYKTIDSNITKDSEGLSIADLVKPGALTVDVTKFESDSATVTETTDVKDSDESVINKVVKARADAADYGKDTYKVILKDGENTTEDTVVVALYTPQTKDDTLTQYVPINTAKEVDLGKLAKNGGEIVVDDDSIEVEKNKFTYKATETGSVELTAHEVLNGEIIGNATVTLNAYYADETTIDYYIAPGETQDFDLNDDFGTIGLTGLNPVANADLKNNGNGSYTFSSDKAGTYTATFTDVYTATAAAADAINAKSGEIKVVFHVAETYLAVSDSEVTVEAGDESDEITVTTSSTANTKFVITTINEDGKEAAAENIDFELVSKAKGTYKVTTKPGVASGVYTITAQLRDGAGADANIIDTATITVTVTKHVITSYPGVVTIRSVLDEKMVLDVKGASIDDSANVQLYKDNGSAAQQFTIVYDEDSGYYTIRNVKSGKVLDVAGGSAADGTNVQQYEDNGTLAQKWEILFNDIDDSYTIVSALDNNLVLDLAGAGKSNGTNLQVYTANGTDAQKFKFGETEGYESDVAIDEDTKYVIASALNDEMVIDIAGGSKDGGANAQLYSDNGTAAQQFTFEYDESGLIVIKNVGSNKVLDVAGGARNNGANVQQYTANDTVAQKWVLEQNDDGTVSIRSVHSGLYLDIAWGSAKDGSNVQLYKGNGTKAQKFILIPVEDEA